MNTHASTSIITGATITDAACSLSCRYMGQLAQQEFCNCRHLECVVGGWWTAVVVGVAWHREIGFSLREVRRAGQGTGGPYSLPGIYTTFFL